MPIIGQLHIAPIGNGWMQFDLKYDFVSNVLTLFSNTDGKYKMFGYLVDYLDDQ